MDQFLQNLVSKVRLCNLTQLC